MEKARKTVRLETLSQLYDVPLQTLRKWAAQRMFPGIIKRKGARRLYVSLEAFDVWFKSGEENSGVEVGE